MKRLSKKLIKQKLFSQIKNSLSLKNDVVDKFTEKIKQTKTILILQSEKVNPIVWIQVLQDKLEKVAKSDKNLIVLKQSKFWARSITWVLISSTGFAIGWVNIAKTDEVVIAPGKLEPKGGVVEVQMPLEGIAQEILVKEGELVSKGQLLIKLDTEITEAQNKALRKSLELNQLIKDKLSVLVNEGAVSELQFIQQKEKIEEIKTQIKVNTVKLKYQEILSPVTGLVFELQPKSPGYVATTSQPVMKIVPTDNLLAKIEIDSRTIGFVKTGKLAEISIDSFPATDFGVLNGTLTRIGSDALPPDPSQGKGYRFPAEITLNDQFLELKSGKKLPLQAGMSLSANIKLRKVSYIQLLLNKFGDKAASLKSL